MMPEGAPPSMLDLGHKQVIDQIRAEKPSSFTVGGTFDGKRLTGGITYDRAWKNGLGLTAYLKAYWNDLPVSVGKRKPAVAAGIEAIKKF